ncbi:MAG: hypothetical protein MUO94_03150 [Thermoplasmata archaeon]|nr:hypothetical protein [Thermoplasmata archaeon]
MVIKAGLLAVLLVAALVGCLQMDSTVDETDGMASRTCFFSEVPEDFTLTYSYQLLNLTRDPVSDYFFEVSSNGSATVNMTDHHSGLTWAGDATLGEDVVEYLRNALEEDGACGLAETYNDAGWQEHVQGYCTEVLEMNTTCGNLTVEFLGNAMTGIMPHTTVALGKLMEATLTPGFECLAIDVEVDASLDSEGIITVSATVVNEATHDVTLGAVCEDIWPASIVRSNGCSIADLRENILPMCVLTIGPGETYEFEPKTWNASGVATGCYIVMATLSWSQMGMTILEITEDLGHENEPPNKIRVSVEEKETSEWVYTFDASASCDAEDIVTDLQVRWDWYNDGIWDTDWSYDKVAEHTFENISGYSFAIEVMDTDGAVSTESLSESRSTERIVSLPGGAMVIGAVVVAVILVTVYLVKARKGKRSA